MPAENSVSVAAGSTLVGGNLTSFIAAEWDLFIARGIAVPVHAAASTSQLLLKQPWPAETDPEIPAGEWSIVSTGPFWNTNVTTNKQVNALLARIDGGLPLKPDAVGPLSDRGSYNDQAKGFTFLSIDGAFTVYAKTSDAVSSDAWSAGHVLQPSPAQTTTESIAARDAALLSAELAASNAGLTAEDRIAAADAAEIATAKAAAAAASEVSATFYATLMGLTIFDMGTLEQPTGDPLDMGTL